MVTFTRKLKKWIYENDISVREFAAMLQCNYGVARRYVSNEQAPCLSRAIEIERITRGEIPCSSWYDLAVCKPAKKKSKKKDNRHAKKNY